MRNFKSVLNRVFDKSNKEVIIETIKKYYPDWAPTKKQQNVKKELYDQFMKIEELLEQAESIQELLETAALVRTQGFPAYTYKLITSNVGKWGTEDYFVSRNCRNYVFKNKYQITIQNVNETIQNIEFELEVKEHNEIWKYGTLSGDSLSGLSRVKVHFEKQKEKLSIHAGNENINEVCKEFIKEYLKWPLETYLLKPKFTQASQIDNTDFITALVLDFVYNRLSVKGFDAKFKEIKFKNNDSVVSKRNAGIKTVTLNGKDIISSQLACEYVTTGSSIERFKLEVVYKNLNFSADFTFKGKENNQLKIVIYETNSLNEEIMNELQSEYIDMCLNGIKDVKATVELLETIRQTFIKADKYVYELVEELMTNSNQYLIEVVSENIEKLDENSIENIYNLAYNNEILLQAIGISERDSNLENLYELIGYD
ncbi:TPA: hypothetical protein ACGW69_005764, partial [Bacillus cereus]